MTVAVLDGGTQTAVQDAMGRRAWRHLGVPAGGAADPWSARLANRLVGNAEDAALLECTATGPSLQFDGAGVVSLVGATSAVVDGLPLEPGTARAVRAGSIVRVAAGDDLRSYLAIAGGVQVPEVLGSRATDLRSGFGGVDGRALRQGDRLPIGDGAGRPHRWSGAAWEGPIRIVHGPHADRLSPDRLVGAWRVGPEADRTGVRLDGAALRLLEPEVPSMGLPLGAIQVSPDGRPTIMLADRPVTGGYPVPAVVITADVGRVARLRPGDPLTFAIVSIDEARAADQVAESSLAAIEPLASAAGDGTAWAGSHG